MMTVDSPLSLLLMLLDLIEKKYYNCYNYDYSYINYANVKCSVVIINALLFYRIIITVYRLWLETIISR